MENGKIKVANTVKEVKEAVREWKANGLSVGLVPTMGFLHEGHKSLIERAVSENDKVVVSDFVNPIQFGEGEDFEVYPRDFEKDKELCESVGANVIFAPTPEEMYPGKFYTHIDMDVITKILCGKTRPGHFSGVCTVVSKLFNISQADRAYFGMKDAQQLAVIRQMVRDLNMNIEIVPCPIIREEDGLAKSSRNTYLSAEERQAGLVLSKSLKMAKEMLDGGNRDVADIKKKMTDFINSEKLAKIDYVEIVEWDSLESIETIGKSTLIALAVYIGKTRLIDNILYEI